MRKSLGVFLLTAFAAVSFPATELVANVIAPIGLAPGSQYQLIFATADLHNGTDTVMSPYNAFASNEAALGVPFGLPSGLTWNAVVSVATITGPVDAKDNAPSGTLPVYNTAGQEVTAPGVGIYMGALDNLVQYDQFGNIETAAQTNNLGLWTGSNSQGVGIAGARLGGSGSAEIGRFALDSTWLQFGTRLKVSEVTFSRPMYALSSEITVPTPEPAVITLLISALLAIGGHRFLVRRRAGR